MKYRMPSLIAVAWLATMAPASSQSKAGSPPVTANDPVVKIAAAYHKEENDYYTHPPKKASDAELQKYYSKFVEIPKKYLPVLKQVAARHKGSSEGAEALLMIINIAPSAGDMASLSSSLAQLNSPAYLKLPGMEKAASELFYVSAPNGVSDRNTLLRNLIAQSPYDKVKAAAMYSLAASAVDPFASPSKDLTRDDALQMLRSLREKYPSTDYSKRAEGYIFAAEKLQVGMTAPDIEGEDVDGAKFRLSDYRGKVVVLDFWGFW